MFVYIPNFFIIDIFLLLIKNSRIREFHSCSSEVIGKTRIHIALRCFSFSLTLSFKS